MADPKPWEYPGILYTTGYVTIAALLLLEPNDDEHVWRAFQLVRGEAIEPSPEAVIARLREALELTATPEVQP